MWLERVVQLQLIFPGTVSSTIFRMGTAEFKPEIRSVAHFERVNVCPAP